MPDDLPTTARLLSDRAVGELLGIDRRSVWRMTSAGDLPQPVRLPGTRTTRWRLADLEAFVSGLEPEGADS